MSDETKTAADETNAVAGETKAPAPPRRLTLHRVPGLNEAITIEVLDQPGAGGACHVYALSYRNDAPPDILRFQEGPPAAGVNGYSIEALLVIAIDRLSGFQSGPGKCEENEFALDAIGQALNALHGRTGRLLSSASNVATAPPAEAPTPAAP